MNKRSWLWLGIALATATAALLESTLSAHTQDPPPAKKSVPQESAKGKKEAPVLRIATRLVQVSVVVHDKKGEPVANLTKGNFEVLDDGRPQQIQLFLAEANPSRAAAPHSVSPGTFTNRFGQGGEAPGSVTVILIDALNTPFLSRPYAQEQVIRFLRQIQPNDRVALYGLTDTLQVLHDFTSDSSALVQAVASYQPGKLADPGEEAIEPSSATGVPGLRGFFLDVDREVRNFNAESREKATLAVLKAIADHLSAIPGRKNLIWLSGSFPFSIGMNSIDMQDLAAHRSFAEDLDRAARIFNDANLAIYPVDARGLTLAGLDASGLTTMEVLAERTGGKAAYITNDIRGAIRRAIEDSRVSYTLGYYSEIQKFDGKFHSIKVKVDRPGVDVRARRGYFALPDPQLNPKQRKKIFEEASLSPLDATGIGMTVQVQGFTLPKARSVIAQIWLNAHDFRFEETDGREDAAIDFVIAQRDGKGRIMSNSDETVGLRLLPTSYAKAEKEGIYYTKEVELSPDAVELRVVVRDASSDMFGSVTIPVSKVFTASPN
jgi:VWFA-related protein